MEVFQKFASPAKFRKKAHGTMLSWVGYDPYSESRPGTQNGLKEKRGPIQPAGVSMGL
jgi:hypothetical protein